MRVLVVEDDRPLAEGIGRGLRQKGMAVDLVDNGADAITMASANVYDVVVLDRDLPSVHGDDVARTLVGNEVSPRVIMLTAASSIDDRVAGLAMGVDDYLPKPFAMTELEARIRALARRPDRALPPVLRHDDITVDPSAYRVVRGGQTLNLTRKEFGVLQTLMEGEGRVVTTEELLERVWDAHADPFTNAPRITVMTLRRKLGEPPVIETVVGVGYRLGS